MMRTFGQHPYRMIASAARAALRFTANRNAAGWRGAWRPIALYWRRKRRGAQGVRASRVPPFAGTVWLPHFHLNFMTSVANNIQHDSMPRLSPVAQIYHTRVVLDSRRTIVLPARVASQPPNAQRPTGVLSLRHARTNSEMKVQAAVQFIDSARRPSVAPTAAWAADGSRRAHLEQAQPSVRLGAKVQAAAQSIDSARRPRVTQSAIWAADRARRPAGDSSLRRARDDWGAKVPTAAWNRDATRRQPVAPPAIWAADRAQRPNLERTQPSVRLGAKVQAAASFMVSARRPSAAPPATWAADHAQRQAGVSSLLHAGDDSGANIQAATAFTDSARRRPVTPIATWAADRAQRPNSGRSQMSARLAPPTHAQGRTLEASRTSKGEPLVLRPHTTAISHAAPPDSQGSFAAQPHLHPHELVWRRAVPSAAASADSERQADNREPGQQVHVRSLLEEGAGSGMAHAFGHAPATPALKIDAAMIDRLADDVIRRIERRERIERARRGL